MSDIPSPTFSLPTHSRIQSSVSSLPSSPTMRDSADTFGTGKRPLTEVKEEPHEKDDEDDEMATGFDTQDDTRGQDFTDDDYPPRLSHGDWSLDDPEAMRYIEYDLRDDSPDAEYSPNPIAKRQRADASPLSGLASRVGSRMPSFSRKWKSRKGSPNVSIPPPLSRDPSLSRASSSRAPSLVSATGEISKVHGHQLPPTPTRSARDESSDDPHAAYVDGHPEAASYRDDVHDQAKPSTPLLPPIMTQHPCRLQEVPYQSPLQSPSVADPESASGIRSPLPTAQVGGLPSPPLSTKPSIASFHHRQYGVPNVSSPEIKPIFIKAPPPDKWADTLGHANFTIHPEPYTIAQPDFAACRTLRADWDMARYNYAKHLMRVGENSGPTSKIYHLTQEKWAEMDAAWKKNVDTCVAQLQEQHPDLSMSPVLDGGGRELTKTPPLVQIPSLNGPKSEGKFPGLGDEGIVGPMEVIPTQVELREQQEREQLQAQAARRKRKFAGFIKDWLMGVRVLSSKGQEAH
ncbi:MAG: hypothetical protein Q9217_006975 [Psora testacea]